MKTKRFFTLAVMAAFCAGCASTSLGVYDPAVPPEKLCTLEVELHLDVTQFDGNAVTWDAPFNNISIQIPEGPHEFVVDYGEYKNRQVRGNQSQSVYYSAKDINVRYDFTAGHTYYMFPQSVNNAVTIIIRDGGTP